MTVSKEHGGNMAGPKNTKKNGTDTKHINVFFQKCVMLHSFKQNGLQIRNQRKKLHMVAPGKISFRRNFDFFATNVGFRKL